MIDQIREVAGEDWDIDDWEVERVKNSRIILRDSEEERRLTFFLYENEIEVELATVAEDGEIGSPIETEHYLRQTAILE
ncbi:hypothetical protein [Natrialba sp. INN-245]|uniref:hypothetical protein n=1 Tax=Natrialba sp. INN-245 TaxID=2690967 RepID=UPI001312CBA4|nr:hypothetical protein [Natrialba sp. INN-245]MWV41058.1 hypothetical protein [Natrialba sp. INN-245]